MKKMFLRMAAMALAAVVVMAFASPAMAYASWPNADWNQKTLGLIKKGEKKAGKNILLQWHCYAAQVKGSNSKAMSKSHVDGVFGNRTLGYVKNYQLKKGLKADGVVGNATYNVMKKTMSSTSDPNKGFVIYDTNDTIKVPKTSRHTKAGRWFTYNRNGMSADII